MKKVVTSLCLSTLLLSSMIPLAIAAEKPVPIEKKQKQKKVKLSSSYKDSIDDFFKQRQKEFKNGKMPKLFEKNDETLAYIQYVQEVDNNKLKDYSYDYEVLEVNKEDDVTEVKVHLVQEFTFENDMKSGFADEVTISLKNDKSSSELQSASENNNIIEFESDTLETKIDIEKLIEKGKKTKKEEKKAKKEKKDDRSEVAAYAQRPVQNYTGSAAASYAYKYALSYNPNYISFRKDCTNFASQAIYAGGIKQQLTNDTNYNYLKWYYSTSTSYSTSWINVDDLFDVLDSNTIYSTVKSSASSLQLGDIIQYDIGKDGNYEHTAVVTKSDSTGVLVSYHTTDRRDVKWDFFANAQTVPTGIRLIDIH